LALSTDRIDCLNKSIASKDSDVNMVKQKLEMEKKEADSLKIRVDRETQEKFLLKVYFYVMALVILVLYLS
jgi:hypothetical protein